MIHALDIKTIKVGRQNLGNTSDVEGCVSIASLKNQISVEIIGW